MSSKALLFLLLLGSVVFTGKEIWSKFTPPCTEPIKYHLGSFDQRFGITKNEFLSALSQAEKIWESNLQKELFTYHPEGGSLAINLIYDYRQEATVGLSEIEDEVSQGESAYRSLERRYLNLKSEHTNLKAQYDTAVSIFETHNAAYEASVERWNRSKRTDQWEFDALEVQRQALQTEIAAIKALEQELNDRVREINTMVGRLNTLARELNLNVKAYNTLGAIRGETFTGGIYISDENGEHIDIYEFGNRDKLIRVLAHELGHALGIEHIADKEAIMYEFNESKGLKLSAADLTALRELCEIDSGN